ncbi:hypothetical protein AAE02nite_32230 [Adhaeribacter aerolatus]|uniref:Uncharacterized protein n=1 Tax=Adhaeribacter aerolatus TaxID=670289 RepID=A0A512B0S8_9BACT|nr:hypothetical protein [Adhaeribacter aerolatus]GEO05559.1 hypothetical protein AAE02nite_32230 [Adhaeribacter aerolatus]
MFIIRQSNSTEQDILDEFNNLIKKQKRERLENGKLLLTIYGTFFKATFSLDITTKTMKMLTVETRKEAFLEMRSYARAMQLRMYEDFHNVYRDVRTEWKKSFIPGKQEFILKQFMDEPPFEIVVSFNNIFGYCTVIFGQRKLS